MLNTVWSKLTEEEELSYHLLFTCFLWRFSFGIHLSMFSWILHKGKGCLVIDSSSELMTGDDGAPNHSVPAPNVANKDDNPPIFYG